MLPESHELKPVRIKDAETGAFLSVRSLSADVRVDGPFARTRLTIGFHNDLRKTIEGDLVFPLPPSAALCELTVKVGERVLSGKWRPRQRAQAEYNRAVAAGQTATLGETEGEDLARLRVAPIDSGEDVEVTLVLVHALVPTGSGHRLVVPLTYMPRYIEDEPALKPTERAAMDRPRPLTVAARATVTVHVRTNGEAAPVIRSTSHATSSTAGRGVTVVTVAAVPLDRDLHLEIQDRPQGIEPVPWICHDGSEGPDGTGPSTAVAIVPPAFADEGPVIARTITFLVDRSGSMSGPPMQSAIRAVRGALRALGPEDHFNVIAFDNVLEVLARRPIAFTEASLQAADAFISSIAARGGTDASMALAAALADHQKIRAETVAFADAPAPDGAHRLRVIVFMTDGDVAGAEKVLKTAKEKLVDARLHVIGIGDSVNHAMLAALAEQGGGTYMPVATDEDLEKALARLKNAIYAPLWTGIRVVLENEGERRMPKQQEPPGPLDLFAGEPLLIAFRGPLSPGDRLVIEGQRQGGEDRKWVLPLGVAELSADTERGGAAGVIWALLKNRRLTYRFNSEDDATLEGLGISYGMVNRMVALVGIHADPRGAVVEGSVPVALPLPRNIADEESTVTRYSMASTRAGTISAPPPRAAPGRHDAPPPAMALGSSPPGRRVSAMPRPPGAVRPPMPAAFPTPPPPPAAAPRATVPMQVMIAPDLDEALPAAPAAPMLSDSEAGLRAVLLNQGANGLFAGELGTTLAAVAALVSRGHSTREGLFRAELRRTVATLRKMLPSLSGDERTLAALALALLTVPSGEAPPAELAAPIAATLAGLSLDDPAAARAIVRAALAVAPASWRARPLAADIGTAFGLV